KSDALLVGPPGWPPAPPGTGAPPPPWSSPAPGGQPAEPTANLLVEALVSRIPDLTAIEAALACSVSDEDDLLRTEAEDAAAQARIGFLSSFFCPPTRLRILGVHDTV